MAEKPSARIRRAQAFLDWCELHEVPFLLRPYLNAVLEGHRGPELEQALGANTEEIEQMEREFFSRTGRSVYEAAVDVLSRATRRRMTSTLRPPARSTTPPPMDLLADEESA